MLDDLKMIHERDANDALGVAEKQWQQLRHVYDVDLPAVRGVANIVLNGMGGSALFGPYVQTWPGVAVPFEVVRNYDLPAYVGPDTLYIASSYSGNTEEVLAGLQQAEARQARIVVMTSGGQLREIAEAKQYPVFSIPSGIQPRMSAFYFLAALVQLLEASGVVAQGSGEELRTAAGWLGSQTAAWLPTAATRDNAAKQLALELAGRSVVIYSGPRMFPAANKFKIGFNENAKTVAWVNQYPEFNHNEFIGWSGQPVDKPYSVIEIRSELEHERVQKRFAVTERLLSGRRPAPHVVIPKGETVLQQLLWTSVFGDFASLYLALLNGLNPTPIDLADTFKVRLGQ